MFFLSLFLLVSRKSVSLHCVFHSIRFKVNKGWSTAVLLFSCPYVTKFLLNIIYSTSLVSFSRFSKGRVCSFYFFLIVFVWPFQSDIDCFRQLNCTWRLLSLSVSYDCTITMIHLHISVINVIHLCFYKVKGMGDFTKFTDFIICNNILLWA